MARSISPSKLEAYRKQQVELAKKIKEAEAAEREKAKGEAKRKYELAGQLAMQEFEANPQSDFAKALLGLLHSGLARPADRALFNLPALPKGNGEDKTAEPAAETFLAFAEGTQHGG